MRELKNAIERALVFAKEGSHLHTDDFPQIPKESGKYPRRRRARGRFEDIEREAIKATLDKTHYKIGRAAEILGISRKTLLEKRKRYGLL